jgi:hypothetical protein
MAGKRSLDDYPRQITATDAALWLNDRLGREVRFTMCRPHRALLAVSDRLMAWPPEEALSGRPGWSIGGHGMLELRLDDLPGCRVDLDLSPEEWDVNGEEVRSRFSS